MREREREWSGVGEKLREGGRGLVEKGRGEERRGDNETQRLEGTERNKNDKLGGVGL